MELDQKEQTRGLAVFDLMDADKGGTVSIDEICIVHDSDREAMIGILDSDGDGEVDKSEWLRYLASKKNEKGKKKFGYFLSFLEQEVPKKVGAITQARATKMVAPPVVRNLPAPLPELEDSQDPEVLLSLLEQRTERLRGTVVQLGDVYRREVKLYEEFHDKYDELEKSARTRQQQTA